jgi:hypothetical protein
MPGDDVRTMFEPMLPQDEIDRRCQPYAGGFIGAFSTDRAIEQGLPIPCIKEGGFNEKLASIHEHIPDPFERAERIA